MEDRSPTSHRGFLIPLEIISRARKEGISLERLQEMVRLSARCTHARGNRRYEDIIFMVVGKRIVNYTKLAKEEPEVPEVFYRCAVCSNTGRVRVFDMCGHCDGTGCSHCDDGLVPSSIPCQQCEQRRRLEQRR